MSIFGSLLGNELLGQARLRAQVSNYYAQAEQSALQQYRQMAAERGLSDIQNAAQAEDRADDWYAAMRGAAQQSSVNNDPFSDEVRSKINGCEVPK